MSKHNRFPHARGARRESFTQSTGGHHHHRLEHLLLSELELLLRDEVHDPALEDVFILSVTLSPDSSHATIAYGVEADPHSERDVVDRCGVAFERARPFLRARLAASLNLKKLPQLGFVFVGVGREGDDEWNR